MIPKETDGDYSAAGRDLRRAPGGRPRPHPAEPGPRASTRSRPSARRVYQYGKWSWNIGTNGQAGAGEHTAGIDARFIWWNGNAISPLNHKLGTYVAAFGGKRFSLGQWPTTLPPMFTTSG